MKKLFIFLIVFTYTLTAQNQWFSLTPFWEKGGPGMAFNIEAFDMNKDENLDVVVGNWNNTYVYYGGYGILDTTKDVVYTGRMLAVCDYNGDGFDDMITMHFTNFDSARGDYDGEILFYWGSDTTNLAIDTIPDYSIPLPTLYPTFDRFTMGYITVGIQKGDLNNDGKIDIILSSTENTEEPGGIVSRGKIYIYMGKETPTDTADFTLIGQEVLAYYGHFFQIGNINGDEYDDLLISSNRISTTAVSYDSINYLHIFYGSENFIAEHGSESIIYSSFVNPPDSTAGWFLRRFSVDDINGDGIDDVVVGRSFYDYPKLTAVHYGSSNGIDSIPSFTFIQDTTTSLFFSAAGVTQNIGDFNDDGYDDFIMSPAGYQVFALHFGGPYVSNGNNYGAAGSLNAHPVFPEKGVNLGNQTNDNVNDIAVIVPGGSETSKGYIIMYYGQRIPTDVKESEVFPKNFNLYQNYPNPFNSSTLISWHLFNNNKVTIKIYDSLGKKVATLTDQEFSEGDNQIEFDAGKYKLASGVYFCELKIKGGETARIKMLYLK